MTFSSRTVDVACQKCKQGVMEIHYGDKIFGPYQKISHTRRSDDTERNLLDRETIFYHHVVDKEKGFCNCFSKVDRNNPLTYYNVFCKGSSDDSYEEKEKVDCRVIWHEVHGFSDDEMEKNFEFICCNCKRKGPLETFEIMTATTFMNKFA